MKASFLFLSVFLSSLIAQAYSGTFQLDPSKVLIENHPSQRGFFQKLQAGDYSRSSIAGAPELPVQSLLFQGLPEDLNLQVNRLDTFTLQDIRPYPAQQQRIRNQDAANPPFTYDQEAYAQSNFKPTVAYLGDYRGVAITKVEIPMARYNQDQNAVELTSNLEIKSKAETFQIEAELPKKYLIIVPENLSETVNEFVTFKESQGFTVFVESMQGPQLTENAVKQLVADYYNNEKIGFVLFVSNQIPTTYASTSFGRAATDFYYLTMGGEGDYIPDVMGGRIPGLSATEVVDRLNKNMEFEKQTYSTATGDLRVVGIASNEGSSPSDDEYIRSIEDKFEEVYGFEKVHFAQNDPASIPQNLNAELGKGIHWLFYMGHGSGTSWPNMNRTYYVSDIDDVMNQQVAKPVIIDVACQNGKLGQGYLGTSFSSILSLEAQGATAYYGGTVDISWHPPALMARGIAYKHGENNYAYLAEALLAGQMYLAENWSSKSEIVDNMEWYVLQGDPSLNIQF